jgi:hypothetical protein
MTSSRDDVGRTKLIDVYGPLRPRRYGFRGRKTDPYVFMTDSSPYGHVFKLLKDWRVTWWSLVVEDRFGTWEGLAIYSTRDEALEGWAKLTVEAIEPPQWLATSATRFFRKPANTGRREPAMPAPLTAEQLKERELEREKAKAALEHWKWGT